MAALQPEQREAVRRILLKLVTPEGTRARRSAAELEARSGPAEGALAALVGARLIVAREVEGESTFELVHEALISGWGTLRDWLDVAADRRRLIQRLESAAAEWERLGNPRELLWRGRQLSQARSLEQDVGPGEAAFLQRSVDELRREKAWRLLGLAAIPLLVIVVFAFAQLRARRQVDAQVAQQLRSAAEALISGEKLAANAAALATKAFQFYDAPRPRVGSPAKDLGKWDRAEQLWGGVRELRVAAEEQFQRALRSLEAARLMQPLRRDVRRLLAETEYRRALLQETVDQGAPPSALIERVRGLDDGGEFLASLDAPGEVIFGIEPRSAEIRLERYVSKEGQLVAEPLSGVVTPSATTTLPPGSYRALLSASNHEPVSLPFVVRRGGRLKLAATLPRQENAIRGFTFVPEGEFLTGITGDEELRQALGTAPLHRISTGAFWIQRTEVTFGDWIEFLNALPPASVQGLLPSVQTNRGPLELRRDRGLWKLILQPSSIRYESRQGQPIIYPERAVRQSQRWEQFPVSGISPRQAQAYASWQSERLGHRVRLCRESEWERAARGADGRSFTLGERVAADEANFDRTYGRRAGGFGPDEVGSHSKSDSPFGLADMQGNAIEMVLSDHDDAEFLEKGGSWYHDIGFDGHLSARFVLERETRNVQLGFRLCADP